MQVYILIFFYIPSSVLTAFFTTMGSSLFNQCLTEEYLFAVFCYWSSAAIIPYLCDFTQMQIYL